MGSDRRSLVENMALGAWCDVAEESIERDLERARALACRFNSEQGLTTEHRTQPLDHFHLGEGGVVPMLPIGRAVFLGRLDRDRVSVSACEAAHVSIDCFFPA